MNATSKLKILSSICFFFTPFLFLFSRHRTIATSHSTMAETFSRGDAQYWPIYGSSNTTERNSPYASLLRLLRSHSPTSSQLFGFLALFISGGILLFLLGVTVTVVGIGFVVFLPLIIISSPVWIPVFIGVGGFLSVAGLLVGTLAVVSWAYRYFRGRHPVGSDQMDYARGRIYDTASHVKDYAREYGGYFHGRAKDAAPGA
ncbi:PREDICTED: oleosin 1 [Brassica oleracea var. oleracea]|nr:PREDICTED: oleosin 1 [Brassica oleracea var. oleracea]